MFSSKHLTINSDSSQVCQHPSLVIKTIEMQRQPHARPKRRPLWGQNKTSIGSFFISAWQLLACGYKTFSGASHGLCLWFDTIETGCWVFATPHRLYTWPGAGCDQRAGIRCPPIDLDCFITPEMPEIILAGAGRLPKPENSLTLNAWLLCQMKSWTNAPALHINTSTIGEVVLGLKISL